MVWLTWYGHVLMRLPKMPIRRCPNIHVNGGVDRMVDHWKLGLREDLLDLETNDGLCEDDIA